jgi:hypothetical protein
MAFDLCSYFDADLIFVAILVSHLIFFSFPFFFLILFFLAHFLFPSECWTLRVKGEISEATWEPMSTCSSSTLAVLRSCILPRKAAAVQHSRSASPCFLRAATAPLGQVGRHSHDLASWGLDLRAGHIWRRLEIWSSLLHRGPCSASPFSAGSSRRPGASPLPGSTRAHHRRPLPLPLALPPFPPSLLTPSSPPPDSCSSGGRG